MPFVSPYAPLNVSGTKKLYPCIYGEKAHLAEGVHSTEAQVYLGVSN